MTFLTSVPLILLSSVLITDQNQSVAWDCSIHCMDSVIHWDLSYSVATPAGVIIMLFNLNATCGHPREPPGTRP